MESWPPSQAYCKIFIFNPSLCFCIDITLWFYLDVCFKLKKFYICFADISAILLHKVIFSLIDSTLHANAGSWGIRFLYKLVIISFEKSKNHNSVSFEQYMHVPQCKAKWFPAIFWSWEHNCFKRY